MYRLIFFIGLCISIIVYGFAVNTDNIGFNTASMLFLILFAFCFLFCCLMEGIK